MKYFNVVIDNKNKAVDRFFTYKSEEPVCVGQKVKVPFAGAKLRTGFVVEADVKPQIEESKIKTIAQIEPLCLNEEMVNTAIWMKSRYGIRYLDAFNCFFPKGKSKIEDKEKDPLRPYIISEAGRYENNEREYKEQNEKSTKFAYPLTEEQESAVNQINGSIEEGTHAIYLLDGVTSSGKTLIYIEAAQKALELHKTVIMLVPEIGLTGQTVERFIERFGAEKVALLHSKLTTKERYDQWEKLRTGTAKIAIGARIGVFAPLDNIGLVIMDEEHEATYKSDQTPKYDTVDIALKRILYNNGVMVLGSATPSIVSYERMKEGIYKHIKLTKRYNNTPLPVIEVVDMGKELKDGNKSMLSRKLRKQLNRCLEENKQAILFLNRRGYSNYVSCRGCGQTLKCPECSITLTYHKESNKLQCHYCGKKFDVPVQCPQCNSKFMKHTGIGTEKVEEYINEQYPEVSVDRLDIDSGRTRKQIEDILTKFKTGKTQILIGTQLVAKGLDFTNVGLVGIISADTPLNIPDYRAAEKTYQLITQVAGRCGRGTEQGSVIVQTYEPNAYPIKFAAQYDYEGFFNKEIGIRKLLDYPPFTDLVDVSFTDDDAKKALSETNRFIKYIKKYQRNVFEAKETINFSGNRFHTMIKCPKGQRNKLIYYINQFQTDAVVIIDVNPYSMI